MAEHNVVRVHHCSHLDSYAVRSSTRHVAWIVEHVPATYRTGQRRQLDQAEAWRCGCEWGSSGRVCSHILAVQAFEDHEEAEAERATEERGFMDLRRPTAQQDEAADRHQEAAPQYVMTREDAEAWLMGEHRKGEGE